MATKISGTQLVQLAIDDPFNLDVYAGAPVYKFFDQQGGTTGFFILNGITIGAGVEFNVAAGDLEDLYFQFGPQLTGDFLSVGVAEPFTIWTALVLSPSDVPPEPKLFTSGADFVNFLALTASQQDAINQGAPLYNALESNDTVFLPANGTVLPGGKIWSSAIKFDAGAGNDTIFGSGSGDNITGSIGDDNISGNAGADTIFGGDGIDFLLGGMGDDQLNGEKDKDTLLGNEGNDTLVGSPGAGETLFGNDGNDKFDYGSNYFTGFAAGTLQIIDGGTQDAGKSDTLHLSAGADDYSFVVKFGKDWETTTTIVTNDTKYAVAPKVILTTLNVEKATFSGNLDHNIELYKGNYQSGSVATEMIQLAFEVYGGSGNDSLKTVRDRLANEDNKIPTIANAAVGRGWHAVSAMELNFKPADFDDPAHAGIKYTMQNGLYSAYDTLQEKPLRLLVGNDDPEANALVLLGSVNFGGAIGIKKTLAIVFRGTDQRSDFNDYADFAKHYEKFEPLIDALKLYVTDQGIEKVLVSGHSLGAAMTQHAVEDFADLNIVVDAYTSGTPGAEIETQTPGANLVNLVHTEDLIPQLPNKVIDGFITGPIVKFWFGAEQKERAGSTVFINSEESWFSGVKEHNSSLYSDSMLRLQEIATKDTVSPFFPDLLAIALRNQTVYSSRDIHLALGTKNGELINGERDDNYILAYGGDDTIRLDPVFPNLGSATIPATMSGGNANFRIIDGGTEFDQVIIRGGYLHSFQVTEIQNFVWLGTNYGVAYNVTYNGGAEDVGVLYRVEKLIAPRAVFTGLLGFSYTYNLDGSPVLVQTPAPGSASLVIDGTSDYAQTGNGNITVTGSAKADVVVLGQGLQKVSGGAGDDSIFADKNPDLASDILTLDGQDGNDFLLGGGGKDVLTGGNGNDELDGGAGADKMTGGAGGDLYTVDNILDVIVEAANAGSDVVLSSINHTMALNVETLILSEDGGAIGGTGNVSNNEIVGNAFANTLAGAAGDDRLVGNDGNDVLEGGAGNDTIEGGIGADTIKIAGLDALTDTVDGGDDNDTVMVTGVTALTLQKFSAADWSVEIWTGNNQGITGGTANDELDFDALILASGIKFIDGLAGNDTLTGTLVADDLRGGLGDDILNGGAGNDVLNGGAGKDKLDGGDGLDVASYESSTAVTIDLLAKTIAGGEAVGDTFTSIEGAIGGTGIDKLTGDHDANLLFGRAGDDFVIGNDGNDTLEGGAGKDDVKGGEGDDTILITGSDALLDSYSGGNGTDTIKVTGTAALSLAEFQATAQSIETWIGNNQGIIGTTTANVFDFGALNAANGILFIDGGAGDDVITGTKGADDLRGGVGNDILKGGDGNDVLEAGVGNDNVDGGAGNDVIRIGGTDALADLAISGGADDDKILVTGVLALSLANFNAGTASIETWTGNNQGILGGAGNDKLDFSALTSASGIKFIDGAAGNDTIAGTLNADNLIGGIGDDTLDGAGGNDVLVGGAGKDALKGGSGIDTASYAASTAVTVDLLAGTGSIGDALGDTLIEIENLLGGTGNDKLVGDNNSNALTGGAGNDILIGNGGNDTLDGGAGIDNIDGGAGDDLILVSGADAVTDILNGGADTDTVQVTGALAVSLANFDATASSIEVWTGNNQAILGTAANDKLDFEALTSATGITFIDGGAGDDKIIGTKGADDLRGGAGNDILKGGDGNDVLEAGAGNDNVDGGAGNDVIRIGGTDALADIAISGGADDDKILVTGVLALSLANFNAGAGSIETWVGNNQGILGGTGNDKLDFSALTSATGIKFIDGAAGNDTIAGTLNADQLIGGIGDDTLDGAGGNDVLVGGAGKDALKGGSGIDTASYAASTAVRVDLLAGTGSIGDALGDTLIEIENLLGGTGNDKLVGDNNSNALTGGAGNDILIGNGGNDTLDGGAGIDNIDGGAGDDLILVSGADAVTDILNGGDDTDTVQVTGAAVLSLANFNAKTSSIEIWTGNNQAVLGTAANDKLDFSALSSVSGIKFVDGGAGNDEIIGTFTADTLQGGAGNDVLKGGDGDDLLVGGAGADLIAGEGGTDTISYAFTATGVTITLGSGGAEGSAGIGGDGAGDKIAGVENVIGSTGNDKLTGNTDANVFIGGKGNDILDGGAGADLFVFAIGDGKDTINNFEDNIDRIDVRTIAGIEDFGSLAGKIAQVGANTVITFDANNTTTLANFDKSKLEAADFRFKNAAPTDIELTLSNVFENNAANHVVGTLAAIDADDTVFTFELLDSDGGNFAILNGNELAAVNSLNAEEATEREITVQVTDSKGAKYQEEITIKVLDKDEFTPAITSDGGGSSATINVNENSTAVTTVTATDGDVAPFQYAIVAGADINLFTIDAGSGVLSFITAPDFEAPGDANLDNSYQILVRAISGGKWDDQNVTVKVQDQNEFPVEITGWFEDSTSANIFENTTALASFYAFQASDADGAAEIKFSVTGGADAALIQIDEDTGEMSFLAAPDAEAPGDADLDNIYEIVVKASDGSNFDTRAITINVLDKDEFTPAITSDGGGSSATINVNENSTAVTTVTATDGDVASFQYAIVAGADINLFTIDAGSGVLSFITAPDFEAPGDANLDNSYQILVRAISGGKWDDQNITVKVTDADEFAPEITSNGGSVSASIDIDENTTAVTTVTATDQDPSATFSFSIASGVDAALFDIDEDSGELSFKTAPDFENPQDAGADNVYDVTVKVSGGANSDTQDLTITVLDASDDNAVPDLYAGAVTTRISQADGNTGGDGMSEAIFAPFGPFSTDGNHVVFYSAASNLVAGDTNGKADFFISNLQTGELTRVDTGNAGSNAVVASLSGDGRYLAFLSASTDLFAGDTDDANVLIYDRVAQSYEGLPVYFGGNAEHVTISGDGRYVAFDTPGSSFGGGIFIYDRQANTVDQVVNFNAIATSFSYDGAYLAVWGDYNNDGSADALVLNTTNGAIELVSAGAGGAAVQGSGPPSISSDGRYVAFASADENIAGTANNVSDIFVYDRDLDTVELVSLNSLGNQLDVRATDPVISGDGRYVTFYIGDGANSSYDVVLRDRLNGTTETLTVSPSGNNSYGYHSSISPDGSHVVFDSFAQNLVDNDSGFTQDVFVREFVPQGPLTEYIDFVSAATVFGDAGELHFTDADTSDTHSVSVTKDTGAVGTLVANITNDTTGSGTDGLVSWTYEVDRNLIPSLNPGEIYKESFFVDLHDASSFDTVRIDIAILG